METNFGHPEESFRKRQVILLESHPRDISGDPGRDFRPDDLWNVDIGIMVDGLLWTFALRISGTEFSWNRRYGHCTDLFHRYLHVFLVFYPALGSSHDALGP